MCVYKHFLSRKIYLLCLPFEKCQELHFLEICGVLQSRLSQLRPSWRSPWQLASPVFSSILFHKAITADFPPRGSSITCVAMLWRKDAKMKKLKFTASIEQFFSSCLGIFSTWGNSDCVGLTWHQLIRAGRYKQGDSGEFELSLQWTHALTSTSGVPLMCSCCLFTHQPACHCGLVTLNLSPSTPLHPLLVPRPPQTHLFFSGRPLIHAALAPSPDPALYFWILLLIHTSLHLRNDKLSGFSPSQESSFSQHMQFCGFPLSSYPFFFYLPSTSSPCFTWRRTNGRSTDSLSSLSSL